MKKYIPQLFDRIATLHSVNELELLMCSRIQKVAVLFLRFFLVSKLNWSVDFIFVLFKPCIGSPWIGNLKYYIIRFVKHAGERRGRGSKEEEDGWMYWLYVLKN